MRIAINGCGIAGPTLAWWLKQRGHEPMLFEKAAALRPGGYVIDFWGSGFDVAERMGLVPQLLADGYRVQALRNVTRSGRTASALDMGVIRSLTGGRYVSIERSRLSARLVEACAGLGILPRFGCPVTEALARGDGVALTLGDGSRIEADLLIGADGLHSAVRRMALGADARVETRLGLHVAAFTLTGYPRRDELTYVTHTEPGRQIGRFALRDDRTLILMVFADRLLPEDGADPRERLRRVYRGMGWEAPAILAAMAAADDLYFDRVSQIRMPAWSRGRIGLVGDAAACVSLLAGEGSGLAMTEAYVLAGELARARGDPEAALTHYRDRLHGHLVRKQKMALRMAGYFAPRGWLTLIGRDLLVNLMRIPGLARPILGRSLAEEIALPDYGAVAG